ncbi:MAG: tetratricopeptide repeat protein, partial [Spirochaetes bacterium]|nr:tetratricopeptide repeat protein [Spirochaetota bacterium]
FFPLSGLYPEQKTGAINLKQVADDLKFRKGAEFYRLERYDLALNELYEYLEIYYDGTHRGEAYRKIADIHIKQYNYQKAVEVYRRLYEEFSSTDEGVDGFFQMGICYLKMGYDSKAEAIFRSIIQEHPGTTGAANAEIQLELLKISR